MIFFEYEQVVKIHRSLIEKTGGMDGIRDAQLLDSALKTPFFILSPFSSINSAEVPIKKIS